MKALIAILEHLKQIVPPDTLNNVGDRDNSLIVLIDPGHGGMIGDHYATAPSKMFKHDTFTFYEGVWNRLLAYSYAYLLHDLGFNYKILVTEDIDIPLSERVRRANDIAKYSDGKTYYHSIHANASTRLDAQGVEVFTSPGETKSDFIATLHYQTLSSLGWTMRSAMGDGDLDKEEDFYVLKHTSMPAILTETGFYSNLEQCRWMMKVDVIQAIADCFLKAHKEVIRLNLL